MPDGELQPAGVVLAGGLGRRMGGADKAMLPLLGRSLLAHAVARIGPQVAALAVNANGDPARPVPGLPVIGDTLPGRVGPLAGVLAAMRWAATQDAHSVFVSPVDTPMLPDDVVKRLQRGLARSGASIAFARQGSQPHPAVGLWPVGMADSLEAAVVAGARRLRDVLASNGAVPVDFDDADAFCNVNTPADLARADTLIRATIAHRSTARLRLRPPAPEDRDPMIALFARPELVAHRPDPRPDGVAASTARLERDQAHWQAHGFGRWAIEEDGRTIGFGGLTAGQDDALSISYHLEPEAWGRGLASELVAEAVFVAFRRLAALGVVGMVRPGNPASRRVLERNGFVAEGLVELHAAPTMRLGFHV